MNPQYYINLSAVTITVTFVVIKPWQLYTPGAPINGIESSCSNNGNKKDVEASDKVELK